MNTHSKSYFTKLLSVFTLTLFIHTLVAVAFHDKAVAAQVSQAQIDQFKKLPASQQQALAKSMGVDLNGIKKQISAGKNVQPDDQATPVYPRGTQFVESARPENTTTPEKLKNKVTPFGYDVFANAPSTFAPSQDIAIPEGYILGIGDSISIQVFGKENMELELAINREGKVVFPSHGPFAIAGLSFAEMKKLLSSKLKEKIIGVDVVIGMASLRSMRVFVLGDAYKPGPYTLSSLSSITHALFAAGGISSIGSLRNIQLKRAGKLVTTLDLYDLLIKGDSTNDLLLQSGDVVFIPPVSQKVTISGLVTRPAIYELASGDTFSSVLNMAGGALPSAHLKYTELKRYSKNTYRRAVNIDLSDEQTIDDLVFGGDEIRVKQTEFLRTPKILPIADAVTLMGAVKKAGKYQWQKGQKVADFLPQIDTHLLDNADLQYALVVREINSARDIEVLQFSLANALLNRNSAANILLQPKDKILVFSNATNVSQAAKGKLLSADLESLKNDTLNKNEINKLAVNSRQRLLLPVIEKLKLQSAAGQPLQLTEIDGQVKYPGTYPLAKNARLKDLVVAAGGVEESAYLANAELTRNHIEGITARKQSQRVVLAEVLKGTNSENILLQSKDRLNVHKIPLWSENSIIELKGEFLFPGRYTIRRGDTLSDVIKKAGGLTEFAHVKAAVFSRTRLKALEQKNIKKVSDDLRVEIASKSLSDSNFLASYPEVQSMLTDLVQLEPLGRLVLELDEVIKDNDYNVLLENGDVLFVPMKKNSVNVVGQVQVSSSHIYSKGLDVDDYIAKSGGLKMRADGDRVYIIAANGNVVLPEDNNWFSVDNAKLLPGDTVVVPLNTEYMNGLTLWSSATQILYNSAVAIAAISGL
ncbi:MAG: SLBB domain-containing protein [Litorilituus sp.]|nr:SLBB domain-containing protein [Litorilituus sp.]